MSRIAKTERLLRNVLALRRVERLFPDSNDLETVRSDLEQDIGPTVTRSVAARLLGISQTTVDRWIARGEIPIVISRSGRQEIPRHALVQLLEDVHAATDRHDPLASVFRARHRRTEKLDRDIILSGTAYDENEPHRRAELRSLAYHRAVAQLLDENIVADAKHRLRRWEAEGKLNPCYANRWWHILVQPVEEIAKSISEDSPEAADLRQNSPFAGTLDEPTRRFVLTTV